MRPERAHALSRRGTRTLVELADDYAHTYAPFIQAAVREVGHSYRQVAKWLTRERIPAAGWSVESPEREEPGGALRAFNWEAHPHPLQEIPDASAPSQPHLTGPLYDRRHLSTPFAGAERTS